MSTNHDGHNHTAPSLNKINQAFYIGIGLNTFFTAVEFIVGYATNSLALIADASHNLSDVVSLIISLIGMRLAQKSATYLYTYGYKKASILASLVNSILLVFIVIKIFIEAIERLDSPPEVAGKVIILTAFIGIIINTISAFLFYKGQKQDINIKGAFLHLIVDAAVSAGVVISGIIMYYTNWNIIDPIISFIIGLVILFSTWRLLKESIRLTLDGVPKDIDLKKVKSTLLQNPAVKEIHHLHIWALSSSQTALTVHIVLNSNVDMQQLMRIKNDIKHNLANENIQHSTIELEDQNVACEEANCE
jgi:cobalt-zinc-cadmium efflux system protein